MTVSSERFQLAAADYALLGVDVEAALNALPEFPSPFIVGKATM